MSARAVPVQLARIPNALTIGRLVLVPVFAVVLVAADGGHSWPAAIIFAVAGVTDQVDGFLARRWHVESRFGAVADPLADRLMIDTAVVILTVDGRLPWVALVLVAIRDGMLLFGGRVLAGRDVELQVNVLGKAATWVLYAAICFVMITDKGTAWPLALFWVGVALAFLAGLVYAFSARKALKR
jgi:CDP-diacylglycerol--glycerol-3-phosphate 3-phosphatidyltransferase